MSIILNKPCTVENRDLFIMEYGGHLTRQIYETDKAIYALEPNEIIVNGEVIIDPDYEEKVAEQQRIEHNEEIDRKVEELTKMSVYDVLNNNTDNINIYKNVINSLLENKF